MPKPAKRVGLYARVSLEDQDPEVQLHELRQCAERRGWHVVAEYVDHGVSGGKTSRPALDRLMADARRGKLDLVACWSICRFGRSLPGLVMSIEELSRQHVGFVAATQGIDTSEDSPAATLTLQVLGACAQFERAMIRSRVRAGLAKAKASGKKLGRRPKDVSPEQVHRLRQQGLSIRDIAAHVGVGKNIVARVLAQPCPEIPAA